MERCAVNSMPFEYVLISRRGCLRTGARYHTRGADPLGNVANFVETEQIIIFNGKGHSSTLSVHMYLGHVVQRQPVESDSSNLLVY
jgi:hypothetical protein